MSVISQLRARFESLPHRGPDKVTQARLSEVSGVSRAHLTQILNGKSSPLAKTIDRLNVALDKLGAAQ